MSDSDVYPHLQDYIRSQYALDAGPAEILQEYLGPSDPDGRLLAEEIERAFKANPTNDALDILVSKLGRFPVDHDFGYRGYLEQTLQLILDQ